MAKQKQTLVTKTVAELYSRYPYPRVSQLMKIHNPNFSVNRLNYVLRRRRSDLLRPTLKIWIPGAGTCLAVQTALNYPEAEILATDISSSSLDISRSLAKQLGLKNITFKLEDLLSAEYIEKFDFIDCAGVINHVADPDRGVKILRRALRKNGVAALFVYNSKHRSLASTFHACLNLLTSDTSIDARWNLAKWLVACAQQSPHLSALATELSGFKWDDEPESFADTMVHPNEASYDLRGFLNLISENGFRLAAWRQPKDWQIREYISHKPMLRAAANLPLPSQWELIWLLAGPDSPFFDVYLERDDYKENLDYSPRELIPMRMEAIASIEYYHFRSNKLISRWVDFPIRITRKAVSCRTYPDSRIKLIHTLDFSRDYASLVTAADGKQTLNELVTKSRQTYDARDHVIEFFSTLLSPEVGLVAPCFFVSI